MAIALLFALLVLAPQQHKLSAPLAPSLSGDVLALSVTPDGSRVIYSGDQDTKDFFELYSAPIDGSQAAIKLTNPGGATGTLFAPSPDGAWVLYSANQGGGHIELWRVPPDRSLEPDTLSGALVDGGHVGPFLIAADSTRAVFSASKLDKNVVELFSVPLDASQLPVRVSGTLASSVDPLGSFALSPDSSRVVFQNQAGTRLYSAPLDGGSAPVVLFAGADPSRHLLQFAIAPDSARVLFRADADVDEQYELYGVPLDGSSAPTQLSGTLIANGDVIAFQVDPTSTYATYLADQDADQVFELYGVALAGGTPAKLSGTLASGADVSSWAFTPDGQHVVYHANQQLYSAPSDASSAPIKLSGTVSGGLSSLLGSLIGPDGTTVVFSAYKDASNRIAVYRVPIDASAAPVQLVLTPFSNAALHLQAFTPDGARLVIEFTGLWSVPVDGSTGLERLDDPLVVPGGGSRAAMTADGSRLAFVGDLTADSTVAGTAFSVFTDGGFPPVQLGELNVVVPHGDVQAFALTPDDAHAVYVADQDTDTVFELYSVPLDGSQAPLKITPGMIAGGDVNTGLQAKPLLVTPDSRFVVYAADGLTDGVVELLRANVDGGDHVRLSAPMVGGGDVQAYELSRDGQHVVYLADQDTDGVNECYSAPIQGDPPAKLNGTLGSVQFALSPDGSTVFLSAASGLYRVPVAGGPAPAPVLAGGGTIRFGPDGSQMVIRHTNVSVQFDLSFDYYVAPVSGAQAPVLVYSTDITTDDTDAVCDAEHAVLWWTDGLFVAPTDGSQSAQALLPGPAKVTSAALTPDGQSIVYTSNPSVPARFDLFSIPVDGGTPVKLSGTLSVKDFSLTPEGTRAVFAVPSSGGLFDAYVVPVDGSAAAQLLTTPVHMPGQFLPRAVSPSSNRFLYQGIVGLFDVPLGGCEAPFRLHSVPQTTSSLTLDFAATSQTNEVVFQANLERGDTVELYAAAYRPLVDAVTPSHGPPAGGNVVTLHGSGFSSGTQVFFGSVPAPTTLVDASTLHVTVPAHPSRAGSTSVGGAHAETARQIVVDVRVADCGDEAVLAGGYTYRP